MTSLREELVRELQKLGVENVPLKGREDGFSSLSFSGKEFAHFHSDTELDLRLTKAVIEREGLAHPVRSHVHPNRAKGSPWIEVRFTRTAHLNHIVRLVKLAIAQL